MTFQPIPPYLNAFTRLEIVVSLLLIGVLLAFAWVTYERTFEEADAQALQEKLLEFQNALIEGSQRSELPPKDLDLKMVVEAMPKEPSYQWKSLTSLEEDQRVELSVTTKARPSLTELRAVTFRVSDCGDVCLVALTNFSYYHLSPNPDATCPEDAVSSVCNYLSNE
ncbi:MAG: type II secretion system protein [Vampirovibrionales bacterium]